MTSLWLKRSRTWCRLCSATTFKLWLKNFSGSLSCCGCMRSEKIRHVSISYFHIYSLKVSEHVVSSDTHAKICQNCLTCYINRLFNLLERKVVLQIKFVGCPKQYALKLKIILIATMSESLLLGIYYIWEKICCADQSP